MRFIAGVIGSVLVPGVGQALVGRWRRAAFWLVCAAASLLALWVSVWTLPLTLVLRLMGIVDGIRLLYAARDRPAFDWPAAFVALAVSAALAGAARIELLEAFRMPSSSTYPTLHIGDHVFVDKLGPRLRGVARGDLIVFRNPCAPDRDYVKRVIATAGQTVEVRCDVVYVDGKPLVSRLVPGDCHYEDQREGTDTWYEVACSEYVEVSGDRAYHTYHEADRPERDRAGAGARERDFPRLDHWTPPSCAGSDPLSSGSAPGETSPLGAVVQSRAGAGACEPQLHYVVPDGHVFTLGDNRPNSNDSRYWGSVPLGNVIGRVTGIWLPGRDQWRRFGGVN